MVEMASLDVMPHSVHLFLQMVSHHLWDDTMFLHGADHVIQATPTDFTTMESKRSKFAEQEIKSLSFQEYNDSYPHKKYTLGFSGRPGGPEFYINTMDNTAFHGPGGQDQHALSHEADPCFATIVEGFDVVDLMHKASMEHLISSENMDNSRMRRSRLISARIV
jgi:cyclophilin family peptidyl-prolyl cis-trans isomerase